MQNQRCPEPIRYCVVIPCFNHGTTVAAVAAAAATHCPVIVVNDGSSQPLPTLPGVTVLHLAHNHGKGGALRAGLQQAAAMGFSHAITMDADGQHFAEDLPKFLTLAEEHPHALLVGVRDFIAAGCPTHRRRSNAVSTFWFRVETGVLLTDTQCGFRCYPLALWKQLRISSERYAFELEFLVRASWVGAPILSVPVKCVYLDGTRNSHFRPVRDLTHITSMNVVLVLQSWIVPSRLRMLWSRGEQLAWRRVVREIFSEHAQAPRQVALAVGLGLFFGIAPVWGFQMVLAAACAHRLRLNKAIALVASNISIPPMVPLIVGASMVVGHWLLHGQATAVWPSEVTFTAAAGYTGQWILGSLALALAVATCGAAATYVFARFAQRR